MPDKLKDAMVDRALKRMPKAKENRPANFDELEDHYRKGAKGPITKLMRYFEADGDLGKILKIDDADNPDVPPKLPAQPSRFQPDKPVIGPPIFAQEARTLMDIDPRTKQNVSKIVQGPTGGSMKEMNRSKLPMDTFQGTNLMGVYSPSAKEIGVQPGIDTWYNTLVHELAHASGYGEDGAVEADTLLPTAGK